MLLTPTLHPSIFLVVGCNGVILVSQVPVMTLLVVFNHGNKSFTMYILYKQVLFYTYFAGGIKMFLSKFSV